MTREYKRINGKRVLLFAVYAVIIVMLINSTEISEAVRAAMSMCAASVIPSLFPFMLASDILIRMGDIKYPAQLFGKVFNRIFGISPYGVTALILGLTCGFPIGGKICCMLYEDGLICKEECERLMCYTNNTSPAFVICTVGSMLSDIKKGIIIYIISLAVSIISGIANGKLIRMNSTSYTESSVKKKLPAPTLVSSITDSFGRALVMSAFIISFSLFVRIIGLFIKNEIILCIAASLLEIGTAASYCRTLYEAYPTVALSLLSFSVSFTGISVFMQTRIFAEEANVSMKKYLAEKFVMGVCAAIVTYVLFRYFVAL